MIDFVVLAVICFFVLVLVTAIIRPLVFMFEPLFALINWTIWFLVNPIRTFQRNTKNSFSRGLFLTLLFTGILFIWWIIAYFLTLPLRVITAIYYDVILFTSVNLADSLQEFIKPKIGKMKYRKGFSYLLFYMIQSPIRFMSLLVNGGIYVLDSFLMFGISIVFPTLTMKHGTKFSEAGSKIAQSGSWFVGDRNFTGTGIYFGMSNKVAKNYAPNGSNSSIILVRVSLSFCKTISSLSEKKRDLIGQGVGEQFGKEVSKIYQSVEHYRVGSNWWEYCILKPGKKGVFISSWRIRPVALLRDGKITRIYGGFSHYTLGTGLLVGAISWVVIIWFLSLLPYLF